MPKKGYKQTLEHIAKNSASQKKRYEDPKERAKISSAQKKRYEDPEERRKQSERLKGISKPPHTKEHDKKVVESRHANDEPWHSEETKQKIRLALEGRSLEELGHKPDCTCCRCIQKRGEGKRENHPHWKGGPSPKDYPLEFNEKFKTLIRERDNNTCQLCGKTKEENKQNLIVHHIYYDISNSEMDPERFITLCRSCNSKVNGRRKFYTKFFQLVMDMRRFTNRQ